MLIDKTPAAVAVDDEQDRRADREPDPAAEAAALMDRHVLSLRLPAPVPSHPGVKAYSSLMPSGSEKKTA